MVAPTLAARTCPAQLATPFTLLWEREPGYAHRSVKRICVISASLFTPGFKRQARGALRGVWAHAASLVTPVEGVDGEA